MAERFCKFEDYEGDGTCMIGGDGCQLDCEMFVDDNAEEFICMICGHIVYYNASEECIHCHALFPFVRYEDFEKQIELLHSEESS